MCILDAGLEEPLYDYAAIPGHRYRWDFVWLRPKIVLEVQGGSWIRGGHTFGRGLVRDAKKNNLAVRNGWKCFYVTTDMINNLCQLDEVLADIKYFCEVKNDNR